MPVTKPLYQQKVQEMYDRLIKNPAVDPWKLGEAVLKSMEFDPDNFKAGQQVDQPGGDQPQLLQKMVDLAGVENSKMINGEKVEPTPYASPVHTEIHIEFMKSKSFKEDIPPNSPVLQIFTDHVMGELLAQQSRGQAPGAVGGQPAAPGLVPPGGGGQPGGPPNMGEVIPGRIEGSNGLPTGAPGNSPPGVQVGGRV